MTPDSSVYIMNDFPTRHAKTLKIASFFFFSAWLIASIHASRLKKQLSEVNLSIATESQALEELQSHLKKIEKQLRAHPPAIRRYVVPPSGKFSWCAEQLHDMIEDPIVLEDIRPTLPFFAKVAQGLRSLKGTPIYLAPYSLRLRLEDVEWHQILSVFDQLESPNNAIVVESLLITPSKTETPRLFSATAIIDFPQFILPEDYAGISRFVSDIAE